MKLTGHKFAGPARDERVGLATASAAHKWAAENNLEIRCPFWGGGVVTTTSGVQVAPECLPDVVREHIVFLVPQGD